MQHVIPKEVEHSRKTLLKNARPQTGKTAPGANLHGFCEMQALKYGEAVFLDSIIVRGNETANPFRVTHTFAQFHAATNRFANILRSLGISAGGSVGYIGENLPQMHITYIGSGKAGCLVAPLNPKDQIDKWLLTFQDCQAEVIVVQDLFFDEKFFSLARQLTSLKHVFVISPSPLTFQSGEKFQVADFDICLERQSSEFAPAGTLSWNQPFLLVYTSGTTGTPKGVVISLETIWRCAESINQHFGFSEKDATYAQLSGFHVNHIVVSFWGAFAGGYRCMMTNRFVAQNYFSHLKQFGITISSVVPTNLAYALKAEIDSGLVTRKPAFQKTFLEFLQRHIPQQIPEVSLDILQTAWEKSYKTCAGTIDQVRFYEEMSRQLAENLKTELQSLTFAKMFRLGFSQAFSPCFHEQYGCSEKNLTIICGAGDLALDLALNFSRTTGLQITQGWGMSEGTCYNSMNIARPSWLTYWMLLGSIGIEMTTTNMCILKTDQDLEPVVDQNHLALLTPEEMSQGKVGMMAMRGAVSSLGYFNNPSANEKSYKDSWLLTGDAGNALWFKDLPGLKTIVEEAKTVSAEIFSAQYPKIDKNDYQFLRQSTHEEIVGRIVTDEPRYKTHPLFFIKGRIKDILICKGQNIPCDVIEAGALSHAAVFEAVAVPIADIDDGEVPGMVVTLHADARVNAATLLQYIRNRDILPRLYWPVMLAIVKVLPKTPTGKYQRIRAREIFVEKKLTPPFVTDKFSIEVLDLAISTDYDLNRRPSL